MNLLFDWKRKFARACFVFFKENSGRVSDSLLVRRPVTELEWLIISFAAVYCRLIRLTVCWNEYMRVIRINGSYHLDGTRDIVGITNL